MSLRFAEVGAITAFILAPLMINVLNGQSDVCRPPNILLFGRQQITYYTPGEVISFPCRTSRNGGLTYSFWENGQPLNMNRSFNDPVIVEETSGSVLQVTPYEDTVTYQCRVSNECGVSVSDVRTLRRAILEPFRGVPTEEMSALVGSSVVMRHCVIPRSVPSAVVRWILEDPDAELSYEDDFSFVPLDNRVTMDYEGRLYITNVHREDNHNGQLYVCTVSNMKLMLTNFGSGVRLLVRGNSGGLSSRPTTKLWSSPSHVFALRGERVRFKCIFGGNPMPEIEWRREGNELDRSRTRTDHFEMVISAARPSDAGNYTCTGSNIFGRVSQSFTLTVDEKPRWTRTPMDVTVSPGATVTFPCRAEGRPSPHVHWFINGVPIELVDPNPRRSFTENGLTMAQVESFDSQVIQCNASNVHGYIWAEAFLQIRATSSSPDGNLSLTTTHLPLQTTPVAIEDCTPPTMDVVNPMSQRVRYFSSVHTSDLILCRASGSGRLQYSWLKNGRPMDIVGSDRRLGGRLPNDGVWFLTPQQTEDLATYQCKVTNDCGTTLSNETILQRGFLDTFPVTATRQLRAIPGSSLVVPCVPPRSDPKPSIFWSSTGTDGQEASVRTDSRVTMDYHGNLYITKVLPEDDKVFHCNALNAFLQSIVSGSNTAVQVQDCRAISARAELMWRSPSHVVALHGSTAKFKCIFSGNPEPTIQWHRAGHPVTHDRKVAENFELTISNVQFEDAGEYTCVGSNDIAVPPVLISFTLDVETVPSWVHRPQNKLVGVGDSARFLCEAGGQPRPEVQWFINGVPIDRTSSRYRDAVSDDGYSFELADLQASDSMALQCNVSNNHGYLWADARLQVRV